MPFNVKRGCTPLKNTLLFGGGWYNRRVNKVLVTGLAIGQEADVCQVCNYDLDWLVRYPSVLIWADKIIVPKAIWEAASSGLYPGSEQYPELSKSIKLIFEIARGEEIIDVRDPTSMISPVVKDEIGDQVEKDREQLAKLFPEQITLGDDEKVPGQLFVNGIEYCWPRIWTIYASFVLARAWDAHCLFSEKNLGYCKYKFGLSGFTPGTEMGKIEGFHTVFNSYVPNEMILPEYATTSRELCSKCAREQSCKDSYLIQLEKNVKEVLQWRDYDEIQQLKEITNQIVEKRAKAGGVIDPADIRNDLEKQQNKLRRRLRLVFPKVRRWSNITTVLSIPVALAGFAAGSPLITITGGSLAGLSQATKKVIEVLSSKYSWVGFVSKDANLSEGQQ